MTSLSEIIRVNKIAHARAGIAANQEAALSQLDRDAAEHRESLRKPGETDEEFEQRQRDDNT